MGTVRLSVRDFADAVTGDGIVVVDFTAARSGAGRRLAPVLEAAARSHPDVVFATVDTDAEPELAAAVGVRSVPTVMVYRDGVLVFAEPGALPAESVELLISTVRELDMPLVRRLLRDQ